ncbi:MAG: DUF1028 domain-containing protein [Verrucomicrobiae bacterium]|nr:DUF1028 domain-containing protein [Verrucomicrobiae bacterium]MCP5540045.1 DUF1028 domain-containing protein [Akkermansiaceae bacterium]MCP5549978.1 DUF1028 domain-containing protein [Akkermansiaceae bacterium]
MTGEISRIRNRGRIGVVGVGAALSLLAIAGSDAGEKAAPRPDKSDPPETATFSIVAVDRETGEIGVAVQSRIVGVGAIVPWAKAGVGAVATQAFANVRYGPVGLLMLELGSTPEQTIELLTRQDPLKNRRQIGVIAAAGNAATFTGDECQDWAGGRAGDDYAVQGNILAGEAVVEAMAKAFEAGKGKKLLAERLLDALEAGQTAGGDKRGKQSAALLIVREGWGYGGLNDRFRDIRVDENPDPIAELRRVYGKHRALFPRPDGRTTGSPSPAEPGKPKSEAADTDPVPR